MANNQSTLPEGTDSIVSDGATDDTFGGSDMAGSGAGAPSLGAAPPRAGDQSRGPGDTSAAGAKLGEAAAKVGDATAGLRDQAVDKARDYASQGKERAVGALDNVVRLVDDAAGTIDDKVGAQYGDYARRASEYVAGFADTLREKDVDELFADAREVVRKSPAIAIGAAAAIGFVLARVLKSGLPAEKTGAADETASDDRPAGQPAAKTPSTATTVAADPAA